MNKTWKNILLIFLFATFLSILLFISPLHRGHDTTFHVANILAIEELLEKGNIFSLIVPNVASNLGYGTRIFYPPLSHTLTAALGLFFSTTASFRLIHFLTIFLSGVSMFFLAQKFSSSKRLALFSSLFYMAMPYFLSDIYIRCALAESFLFIFIPLILLGIIYLLEGDAQKFYPLFVIGYVGGMLSHLTMMVYATFLFGIFLLIYSKEFFRKEKLIPFIKACFVVLLCTLFFLTPLIVHKIFGDYAVFQDGYMARDIYYAALKIFDFNPFRKLDNGTIEYYFPVVVNILLVFTYFFRKKITFPKYTKGLFIFGFISFIMSSVLFPWDYLPYSFQMIQFPWRMQTFLVVVVSLFAPLCLSVIKESRLVYTLIVISLLIGSSMSIHFAWDVLIDFDNISWVDGMGWGYEYLPSATIKNFTYFENRNSNEIILLEESEAEISILKNEVPNLTFSVSNLESEISIELPRIFYFGYQLTLDGIDTLDLYENENGFMETKITENGVYELTYIGYPISRLVSFASIFIFSGIYFYTYSKKKNKLGSCLTKRKQKL